jgi:hypothetical protein
MFGKQEPKHVLLSSFPTIVYIQMDSQIYIA